jgi:AcrR family transcriptional regulator
MSAVTGSGTRAALLDAAEVSLEQVGSGKPLMNDVARRAGFSRPTLYRHFPDRDALIRGVRTRRSELIARRARRHIARQRTWEDKVVEGMLFLVEHGRADAHLPADPETARGIADRVWIPVLVAGGHGDEERLDDTLLWFAHVNVQMQARLDDDEGPDARDRVRSLIRRFVLPAFTEPAAPRRTARRDVAG